MVESESLRSSLVTAGESSVIEELRRLYDGKDFSLSPCLVTAKEIERDSSNPRAKETKRFFFFFLNGWKPKGFLKKN